jgi:hypothetical protein
MNAISQRWLQQRKAQCKHNSKGFGHKKRPVRPSNY